MIKNVIATDKAPAIIGAIKWLKKYAIFPHFEQQPNHNK